MLFICGVWGLLSIIRNLERIQNISASFCKLMQTWSSKDSSVNSTELWRSTKQLTNYFLFIYHLITLNNISEIQSSPAMQLRKNNLQIIDTS